MRFNDRDHSVQGEERKPKPTKEEAERLSFRRWQAEKRIKEAELTARQGMKGYRV